MNAFFATLAEVYYAFDTLTVETLPAPGAAVTIDGRRVGELTSACHSALAGPIGLGYVRHGHEAPGTEVAVGDVRARVAGNDLLLRPPNLTEARSGLLSALNRGRLPRARLVEAVTRVLTLKFRLDDFKRPDVSTVDNDKNRDAARAAAAAVLELTSAAAQQGTEVARVTAEVLPTPVRMAVGSGIPDIVARATDTARLTGRQAAQTAWAGIALGLVSVATASVLLQRSRRVEGELMTGLGIKPTSVAALAGIESVLPVLLGLAVGAAVAGVTMPFIGPPGRYGGDVVADAIRNALPAGAAAMALVTVAAGLTAAWRV